MPSTQKSIKRLGDEDQVVAFKAYQGLLKTVQCESAPDKGASRAKIAGELAAELNAKVPGGKDKKGKEKPPVPKYPADTRNKVIRLMSFVAGPKEVPALVEAAQDLQLREMARFALERNCSDEATDALLKALSDQVGPEFRAGVVNSLARRNGPKVLAALRKAADDVDKPVRITAVEALANVPDAAHDAMIVKLTKADCPRCRARANKARVRLAETLAKAGKKSDAARIYKAIAASDADAPQKNAAAEALKTLG